MQLYQQNDESIDINCYIRYELGYLLLQVMMILTYYLVKKERQQQQDNNAQKNILKRIILKEDEADFRKDTTHFCGGKNMKYFIHLWKS